MTVDPTGDRTGAAAMLQRWVTAAVPATPQERAAAIWSFAYFFTLLAGYYVLRPLRDEMGIAGGVRNLPWLFTATFLTLLVVQPLYSGLVANLPRARFIPIVYHFFAANLVLFWLFLTLHLGTAIVARVFYVWVAVFSLFALAVFWSFMADIFTADQGKRLFGFIGAGGTAGALLGPVITIWLSVPLGPVNLLIPAVILLEAAVFCVWRLERAATAHEGLQAEPQRLGGSAFAAFLELVRSPYLFGIAAWITLLSFCATILYFEQIHMIAAGVRGADAQTRVFASVDLAVNLLTLATQILATGQLLKRFGTGLAAAALPAIYWLSGGVSGADALGCAGCSSGTTLVSLFRRHSGAPGVLYGARPGRKIQSQEFDRRRHLSRLRRAVQLGVRQPAGARIKARHDRTRRRADGGGLADPVGRSGPGTGTPSQAYRCGCGTR